MRTLLPLCSLVSTGCAYVSSTNLSGSGGIMMAYEINGRVVSDEVTCNGGIGDVSVAMFDERGQLLDETRTDAQGHFIVSVRNPDAAETLSAKLDSDDPTALVTLRVHPPGRSEMKSSIRLPRAISAREYRVRLSKKKDCSE